MVRYSLRVTLLFLALCFRKTAVQTLAMDFWPLILLFAILITGLALTVSQEWLAGSFYDFIAILHAITVVAALLYLPFGKFFHIFQRPAQLGVKLYQRVGDESEGAICARCGERYASIMHLDDRVNLFINVNRLQPLWNSPDSDSALPVCRRIESSLRDLNHFPHFPSGSTAEVSSRPPRGRRNFGVAYGRSVGQLNTSAEIASSRNQAGRRQLATCE
jgi:hypothetical protein